MVKSHLLSIVVSLTMTIATVPDVVNLPILNAKSAIAAVGLELGSVTYAPSRSARNIVIRQSPIGGARVSKTAAVSLVVSSGVEPVGQTYERP